MPARHTSMRNMIMCMYMLTLGCGGVVATTDAAPMASGDAGSDEAESSIPDAADEPEAAPPKQCGGTGRTCFVDGQELGCFRTASIKWEPSWTYGYPAQGNLVACDDPLRAPCVGDPCVPWYGGVVGVVH